MSKLQEGNLDELIINYAKEGKPILGICLGMQLLFENSTEFGNSAGLGLIPGKVVKFPESNEKLPHISWNELLIRDTHLNDNELLSSSDKKDVYFVHSYYVEPENKENILSTTSYAGVEFCSSIKYKNIYGCQFHPEKSASYGLEIISNFKSICEKHK
jgi:glutamine amidotransferase